MSQPSSSASGQTQALADFAFGSDTQVVDVSRPLAWLSPDDMDIDLSDPQQRRFGDYELLAKIGQGGMGVVYRARQHGLERDVAFKLLAAGPWASEEFVARFRREAKNAARMQHPNIVEIFEFGHRDGLNYFSMRLIEGQSLAQRLHDRGPMAPAEAARLLRTLAEAMDYAHRLGVLHLDLKPANVLLDGNGVPLIADFGLARRIDAGHEGGNEEISGSPSYMAPEQATLAAHPLTAATDIHGLGAILYETLTGRPPFMGANAQSTLERVVAELPAQPRTLRREVPLDLDAVCMKCLAKQPSERYRSAKELAEDLGRFIEGRAVSVRPLNAAQRLLRWGRREPRLAGALATALAALALGVAATSWQWREAVAQRDAAKAERDRATIASEIGGYLFGYEGKNRGKDLVAWLRQRLPGDAARQADALADFEASVDKTAPPDSTDSYELRSAVVAIVGTEYRHKVIAALLASNDPHREVHAAMLAFGDPEAPESSAQFKALLQAAIAAHPDDAFTWQVAATYCPPDGGRNRCLYPDAGERLVRIDPGNMHHWLLRAMLSGDPAVKRQSLHEAALRSRFDDGFLAEYRAYFDAFRKAGLPVPPALIKAANLGGSDQPPVDQLATVEASNAPMPNWSSLVRFCLPPDLGTLDAQLRADCVAVGARMARSDQAILSRMIGVALVRPLARGTPLAEEARQVRRDYEYLKDASSRIGDARLQTYSDARLQHDMLTVGELAAWQHRVASFGLPERPPADWKPEDGDRLLSSRERTDNVVATEERAASLLAQGRYAAAAALLEPAEAAARRYFHDATAWRLARFLQHLGQAHAGQQRFAAADKDLQDAWAIVEPFGPGSDDTRAVLRSLIALQAAWDAAEPGKGHDLSKEGWQQKLDALGPTARATAQR